jgi:hypothetical protein
VPQEEEVENVSSYIYIYIYIYMSSNQLEIKNSTKFMSIICIHYRHKF